MNLLSQHFFRIKLGQTKSVQRTSRSNGDVLFSVYGESHRRGIDCSAGLEVPDGLTASGVQRDEISFRVAGEKKASRG